MLRDLLLIVAFCAAAFIFLVIWGCLRFVAQHGPLMILLRAGTGLHLDGKRRTNKGHFRRGTRATGADHRAPTTRWMRASHGTRAGVFWGCLATLLVIGDGLVRDSGSTILGLEATGVSMVLVLLAMSCRWFHPQIRHHRLHVKRPLAVAMAGHLGQSPQVIEQNLKLSRKLESSKPGQVIGSLPLPDHWHGLDGDQETLAKLIQYRLPVGIDTRYRLTRHPMRLELVSAAVPPPEVKIKDYALHMRSLPLGVYFLGIAASEEPCQWDSNEEDPHGAANARTRGGKTNMLSAIIAQGLARGEEMWAIDPKRRSLRHFEGVPGFRLARDPGKPGEMVALILEFERAMQQAIADGDTGTYRTLILEEMNQLQELLDDWWIATKPTGARMMDNPARRAIKAVLHQGAQFKHKVLAVGQDLQAKTMFGARSQFGTVLMNGYTPKQWGYIVGTTPVPPQPAKRGRFYLVRYGVPELIQVVFGAKDGAVNERLWREYALAGRTPEAKAHTRWSPALTAFQLMPAAPANAIPQVLVGYKEAAGYLGITPNAFELRRKRHPIPGEFRTTMRGGKDKPCWHKDTLDLWVMGVVPGGSNGVQEPEMAGTR